jgi:F-type H+-transporting ATPase subunit alpha
VGSAAQTKAMRKVAGPLKLDLAQYRELAAFAQFASDLDKATRDQLTRGEKISEIIKQPQYEPLSVAQQVAILYVGTKGIVDDVPTPRIREFEQGFYRFLESERPEILETLGDKPELTDEIAEGLTKAANDFKQTFMASVGSDELPPAQDRANRQPGVGGQGDADAGETAAAGGNPATTAAPGPGTPADAGRPGDMQAAATTETQPDQQPTGEGR